MAKGILKLGHLIVYQWVGGMGGDLKTLVERHRHSGGGLEMKHCVPETIINNIEIMMPHLFMKINKAWGQRAQA